MEDEEDLAMSNISVRYIVNDINDSIKFYTTILGFNVIMHPAQEFAILGLDNFRLLLSQPSDLGGGGQEMNDGTKQIPGGWNRFEIEVSDLPKKVADLKGQGCKFRNEIVKGVGGQQILLEDPSGNLIELFQYYEQNENWS